MLAGTDKVIRILTVAVAHRSVHRKKPNDILAGRTEQNGIVVGILHTAFTFLVIEYNDSGAPGLSFVQAYGRNHIPQSPFTRTRSP